jgi:hypothetical protein
LNQRENTHVSKTIFDDFAWQTLTQKYTEFYVIFPKSALWLDYCLIVKIAATQGSIIAYAVQIGLLGVKLLYKVL